jgi:hypothetical protein
MGAGQWVLTILKGLKLFLKGGSQDAMMFLNISGLAEKDQGGDYYGEGKDRV